jgi:alpha-L-fucosidase 2
MQILSDLFDAVAQASGILRKDAAFRKKVLAARARLAPMQIGRKGDLQEWLEDWDQKEKSHRHISHLYGLFPGNGISSRRTPDLAKACEAVLEQRGLEGNGWSSAWKMACWARLDNSDKAVDNFRYYLQHYATESLFAICAKALQVDGSFGVTASIIEMLLQSHEDELHLLPALPRAWSQGEAHGLRARGGFEVDLAWRDNRVHSAAIRSFRGGLCRVRSTGPLKVLHRQKPLLKGVQQNGDRGICFQTVPGEEYKLRPEGRSA